MTPARRRWASVWTGILLLALPATVISAVYLTTYARRDFAAPVGYDSPKYVWRANLVAGSGLDALAGSAPEPFRVNADRPAVPSMMAAISALLGVSTTRVLMVLAAVAAVAVGLAAGALGVGALREPVWTFPVFAVAAGASVHVSRMAGPGYTDNLLLGPLVLAAAALALTAADGRAGVAGAVVLLASGVLVHWVFVVPFLGLLAATALALLPESMAQRRRGRPALATPTGRLLTIAGGAALAGGPLLLGLAATEPSPPRLPRSSFLAKLRFDVPRHRFPVTAPLAALGAAALAVGRPDRKAGRNGDPGEDTLAARRRGLVLLGVWSLAAGVAVAALHGGAALPAHRFLAFALGIPVLVACGLLGIWRLAARAGPAGRAVAAAVVAGGLAAGVVIAYRGWYQAHPWMPKGQLEQAAEAGRYLRGAGGDGPVVFLVDLGGHSPLSSTALAFHVIRAALPAEVVPRTLVYLGEPERYLAGFPTFRADPPTFDEASRRHWPSVRDALDEDPIALMMPAFNRNFAASIERYPDWLVSTNVAVLEGPRGLASLPVLSPPGPMTPLQLVALAGAILALVWAAGSGWAAALGSGGWVERTALAPAFGLAVLAVGTVVAGRVGISFGRPAAAVVIGGAAAAGWGLFAAVARRRRSVRAPGPAPR